MKIKKIKKLIALILGIAAAGVGGYFGYDKGIKPLVKKENSQTNSKISNLNSKMEAPAEGDLRVGFWNVVNISGKKESQNEAVAKTILYMQLDVVGMVEISDATIPADKILSLLRQLDAQSDWKMVLSEELSTQNYRYGSNEWALAFYKGTKVEPLRFKEDGKEFFANESNVYNENDKKTWGMPYFNPTFKSTLVDDWKEQKPGNDSLRNEMRYARRPFGVTWKTLKEQTTFTTVFHHADAPGLAQDGKQIKGQPEVTKEIDAPGYAREQGHFEVEEARKMKNVLEWFDSQDGENNNIIMMADTNLYKENDKAFDSLRRSGYTGGLDPNLEENKTSLSLKWNSHANPYEKIFAKGLTFKNAQRYNIFNTLKDKILDNEWKEKALKELYKDKTNKYQLDIATWRKEGWQTVNMPSSGKPEGYKLIRNQISDHSPVFADFKVSK